MDSLKKKSEIVGETWEEELDNTMWAYRTMTRRVIGKTSFALTYGFEARTPKEVVIPNQSVEEYEPEQSEAH